MNASRKLTAVVFAAVSVLAGACVSDLDSGVDENTGADHTADLGTVEAAATSPAGMNIPTAHPRLWFNADRLARARASFARKPYTVGSVYDADDAIDAAMRPLLTSDTTSCRKAIDWAKSVTFSTDGVSSDGARWDGEAVILTFDWCFSTMRADEVTLLKNRWNGYIQALNANPWGGIGMEGNNYYLGYFRNTLLWAVATWHENQPLAATFLSYGLDTRWTTSLKPFLNASARGGAPGEGSAYGRRVFGYLTVPFTSLGLLGKDMWNQTPYFLETLFFTIYSTTPGPSRVGTQQMYETFSYNEDERWLERDGTTNTAQTALGSYLAPLVDLWKTQPVAGYAKRYLDMTGARIENRLVEYVYGDALAAVAPRDLGTLPLDYYASGLGALYAKTAWSPAATFVFQQFAPPVGVGHEHRDAGSFQLWRGGEFLARETVGYAQNLVGYAGAGEVDAESPLAHNTLLFNGEGIAFYRRAQPQVLRLSSTPVATYAAVDLTGAYDVSDDWRDREDEVGNSTAGRVVRETLFVKPLETFVVFDRMEATNGAANVTKTFLMHFTTRPAVSGNTMTLVQGNQKLQLTAAVPANATRRLVDERGPGGDTYPIGQFRAEIDTRGAGVSHFLNVLSASGATDANVAVAVTETATAYTLTLTHATRGKAVVTFQKGIASTGGTFGFAASGNPVAAPLRTTVQPMTVTAAGPAWGN